MTRSIRARVERLEQRGGEDETSRWLRSLTDEELEAEIERVHGQCRIVLTDCGIDCTNLPMERLIEELAAIEKAQAAGSLT